MSLKIEALDHIAIDISDVARAKQFYGDVLGLEEIARPASFDFPGAWYRTGNSVIHLVGRPKPAVGDKQHFCLWAADIKAAARHLETNGYKVEWNQTHKIPGIDRFFIRDPDGNRVEFQGSDGKVFSV